MTHHTTPELKPEIEQRFDELIDNEWWTIDDPDARSMTRTTSKIKQFLATELSTLETKHRAEVEASKKVLIEVRDNWQTKRNIGKVYWHSLDFVDGILEGLNLAIESLTTTTTERKAE